jgi:PadR family transcriptional regulator, regulatory protein AphA
VAERSLTPNSYIILGLIQYGPATPYELKARVANALGNFWALQHAQLYSETARLAKAGLLNEEREEGGRRRKTYSITGTGRKALEEWLATPTRALTEVRDLGTLKLFLGADPEIIAPVQVEVHRAKLAEYEGYLAEISALDLEIPKGMKSGLESGIMHERVFVRFWAELAKA